MGTESKDPEDVYLTKDRLREVDRCSTPERLATRVVSVVAAPGNHPRLGEKCNDGHNKNAQTRCVKLNRRLIPSLQSHFENHRIALLLRPPECIEVWCHWNCSNPGSCQDPRHMIVR